MAFDLQSRGERITAWMVVVAVHAGLLWILALVPWQPQPARGEQQRTRLRLVPATQPSPPLLHTPSLRAAPDRPEPAPGIVIRDPRASASAPIVETDPAGTLSRQPPVDWELQARQWVRAQEPGPAPGAADPLRIGASARVGAARAEAFRATEPVTVHDVLLGIGQLFGGQPPSPCATATANIPGLLTATSERERELLQEELRRQRRYCAR